MDVAEENDLSGSGEPVSIALAGTVASLRPRGSTDLLATPSQLAVWLEGQEDRLGAAPPEVALRIEGFRSLREAIRELLEAACRGDPLPVAAVDRLNQASRALPSFPILDVSDPAGPRVVEGGVAGGRATEIAAVIARSAIEILGGPDRERLKICGAPRCGRFFLASRPRQLWCGPACGNRVRVARHAARGKTS